MIITGSNAPIIFRMPEPIESIKGFSILLCKYDAELKSWTDDDLTFVDNMVIAPLSQDETMEFPLGSCTIHLKWLAENGVVKFNKTIDSYIHKHPDKNILGDGAGTVTYTEGVVYDVDTRTDTIVVRGYSPYANDNGTWEYFDDVKKQYVDTGIVAQGKDGYTPRKGIDYFDGTDGEDGVGVKEVRQIKASSIPGDWNAFEIALTDGKIFPFKIQNGLPGKNGENGRDGYTPRKGVDYFDGKNGKDGLDGLAGADGKDGVGITSMRQTISTTLPAGNNVFTFYTSDGKAASFVVYNGKNGEKGKDGKDYIITETDYNKIAKHTEHIMETWKSDVESLAKGRATGYVFDTKADMDLWVLEHKSELVLGDNLYIRAINVPDYWWDGTSPQELETQKVDLTGYLTESDIKQADWDQTDSTSKDFIKNKPKDLGKVDDVQVNGVSVVEDKVANIVIPEFVKEVWTFVLDDGTEIEKEIGVVH